MTRKALGILVVIAAIFVALAVIGQRRDHSQSIAGDSAGTLLVPGLTGDIENIRQIDVVGAGGERLVRLAREGDAWAVAELGDYPAERSVINSLLISVAEARIVEEKTANPDFHARLGVEDIAGPDAAGLEVTLFADEGAQYSVIFGDAYSGGQRYARLADSEQSVLIDQNPDISRDPAEWVDPLIIDIASDRVQRVEITHADGERVVLSKNAPDDANFTVADVPEDRELQYAGIANATGNLLTNLRLDEVRRSDDEQPAPVVTTEFSTFDGLVITVTARPAGDDDRLWLGFDARSGTAAGSDEDPIDEPTAPPADEAATINRRVEGWEYRIPAYQLSQLTRRMEDLLTPAAD